MGVTCFGWGSRNVSPRKLRPRGGEGSGLPSRGKRPSGGGGRAGEDTDSLPYSRLTARVAGTWGAVKTSAMEDRGRARALYPRGHYTGKPRNASGLSREWHVSMYRL